MPDALETSLSARFNRFFLHLVGWHSALHLEQTGGAGQEHSIKSSVHRQNTWEQWSSYCAVWPEANPPKEH